MITNTNQFDRDSVLHSSICIIGGGASGVSLALELEKSGLDIILIESGGRKTDLETQQLTEGIVNNDAHYPLNKYHFRKLGGKTTVWGGRCVSFDDIDFESRDFVDHSGWPFLKNELNPYYSRAQKYLMVGEYEYDAKKVFGDSNKSMIEGFQSEYVQTNSLERFSLPVNFGLHYNRVLINSKNIQVILKGNCTHLSVNEDGNNIKDITVQSLEGNQIKVKSNLFILASGALDTTKLLLSSNEKHSNGIGNFSGHLGKFYMDHIYGTLGTIKLNPKTKCFLDYEKTKENIYCRKRFTLSSKAQREFGLLNFAAFTNHNYNPFIEDPKHNSGALSAKYLIRRLRELIRPNGDLFQNQKFTGTYTVKEHLNNLSSDLPGILNTAGKYIKGNIPGQRKLPGLFIENKQKEHPIFFQAEQAPNINSTISLSNEKDRLGLPKLIVDWQYLDIDIDTIVGAYQILNKELEDGGFGKLNYNKENFREEIEKQMVVGNHPSGTTRMAKQEKDGVVDPDCKVFGVNNLFVASSSVFPTSSHANPTLTIVAIAMKVAEKVKRMALVKTEIPSPSIQTIQKDQPLKAD